MVVELAPGLYSAKTENGSGSSGVALVEVVVSGSDEADTGLALVEVYQVNPE